MFEKKIKLERILFFEWFRKEMLYALNFESTFSF